MGWSQWGLERGFRVEGVKEVGGEGVNGVGGEESMGVGERVLS